MSYAGNRVIHDADAHIMETPEWLSGYADAETRASLSPEQLGLAELSGDDGSDSMLDRQRRNHADSEYRARDAEEIMTRKNWAATGSFLAEDRPMALDLLGFRSQLMFNTACNGFFCKLEQGDDMNLLYGATAAHNRGMLDFCSVDKRLLSTTYIPLADCTRTLAMAEEAIHAGSSALLIPSDCPREHAPSHTDLDPLWAMAQEAGLPVVFHVGGGGKLMSSAYTRNGLPEVPDFHGGAENFRSVSYMAIPRPVMQTLAVLIIDGVLERYPRLKFGVIEQGAIWMPSWMRQLDAAYEAFARHEQRLQNLSLRPSEYVIRQVRATPYPTEDVGWIVRNSDPSICLFSSDYPHVEGGRNPLKRFDDSLQGLDTATLEAFFTGNFEDLMGTALPSILRAA